MVWTGCVHDWRRSGFPLHRPQSHALTFLSELCLACVPTESVLWFTENTILVFRDESSGQLTRESIVPRC